MFFEFKRFFTSYVIVIITILSLTSCATKEENKLLGAAVGAALGGLVGVQFGAGTGQLLMTAIGAGAGSYLGSEIADKLTEAEKISLNQSINNTAKFGDLNQTYAWKNKSENVKVFLKPVSEVKASKGSCTKVEIQIIQGQEKNLNNKEVCYKNS
tara:strand:- start:590 stop:1054 length:465 start_codon:yes stop_codon:yes gene_type:complete